MDTPTANPTPFAAYRTDASLDKVVRVAIVERALLDAHGALHVPDNAGRERYFAREIDATTQRRWLARRIVDEQDWRDNFARIQSQPHGVVLPTMREVAEQQRAEFERTGRVTVTGWEAVDAVLAESMRRAEAKIFGTEAA